MINVVRKLPKKFYIAFSGGVDSVVLTHVALSKRSAVELLFYHHGNPFADRELEFARYFADKYDLPLHEGYCLDVLDGSKENFWRKSRHKWFSTFDGTIATGHHLDDAIEWYLMTSFRGNSCFMPYETGNFVKPLLLTEKCDIISYAEQNNLKWLCDTTNYDKMFSFRNLVRNKILPDLSDFGLNLKSVVKNNLVKRINPQEA